MRVDELILRSKFLSSKYRFHNFGKAVPFLPTLLEPPAQRFVQTQCGTASQVGSLGSFRTTHASRFKFDSNCNGSSHREIRKLTFLGAQFSAPACGPQFCYLTQRDKPDYNWCKISFESNGQCSGYQLKGNNANSPSLITCKKRA